MDEEREQYNSSGIWDPKSRTLVHVSGLPRTWSLPPEPGAEVKALKGRLKFSAGEIILLTRDPKYRHCWIGHGLLSWGDVLTQFTEITDATHELGGEE